MTQNFPGKYELRIFYNVNCEPGGQLEHVCKMSFQVETDPDQGDPFNLISVAVKGGTFADLDIVTDAFVELLAANFNEDDATFLVAEVWKYEPASFTASFYSSYPLAVTGSSVAATVPASEQLFTFRTSEGGIMKLHLLDTISPSAPALAYPELSGGTLTLVDYLIDPDTGPFTGRDTSYPLALLRFFQGQNENAFKRRYRR